MGGSSLHYDIFNAARLSPHSIVVVKGYRIPKSVDLKRSIVIASSYSGNTEETLACFKQAVSGGAKTIAITRNDHPMIKCRFDKMVEAIKKHSAAQFFSHVYQPSGQSSLERIFSALMWSHYLAYNLAVASNVKPEPVELIETFKRKIANECKVTPKK